MRMIGAEAGYTTGAIYPTGWTGRHKPLLIFEPKDIPLISRLTRALIHIYVRSIEGTSCRFSKFEATISKEHRCSSPTGVKDSELASRKKDRHPLNSGISSTTS